MQAVILCAGRGTRMGNLTKDIPKPLLNIGSKNLLEYKLDALPPEIDEIIILIGHLGDKIKEFFGDLYKDKKISYVVDANYTGGTAWALWQTKDKLSKRFLVLMGDDIYSPESIKESMKYDFSIICKRATRDEKGSRIITDENGNLIDFVTHKIYQRHHDDGGLIFTGLYSLTTDIFNYDPVKLETRDECGLPQTLLRAAKDRCVKIVETDFWVPVGDPEELEKAIEILK